jgi:hypothetical protein
MLMKRNALFVPPILFVLISFIAGLLNFVDTSVRLVFFYMLHEPYPLNVYLKSIFFFIQAFSLILFLSKAIHLAEEQMSDRKLSSFFAVQLILAVVALLLYIDFLFVIIAGASSSLGYLELALYLSYLAGLTGTSFWFALRLSRNERWTWISIVFVMIGLAFGMAFLEKMFFWSQNYLNLVFHGAVAQIGMYAPHVLMFLAAISAVFILVLKDSAKNVSQIHKPLLFLLVPAFVFPVFWNGYKDGLVNFVLRALFYWGFGYVGYEWYSVSLYLMIIVSFFLVLRNLSRRLTSSFASALILLGTASLPFNGIIFLFLNYSSIAGNMISLNSIILGFSLLTSERRNAVAT